MPDSRLEILASKRILIPSGCGRTMPVFLGQTKKGCHGILSRDLRVPILLINSDNDKINSVMDGDGDDPAPAS